MNKALSFVRIIDNISIWVGRITGFFVLAIMIILFLGVISRYVLKQPILWTGEISMILFLVLLLMTGAYVLQEDFHVRMDVFYGRLSVRGKAIADTATFAVFLFFIVILTWQSVNLAWASVEIQERTFSHLHSPIYPSKICLAIACFLLLIQGVAKFIRNIAIIRGRIEGGTL